METLDKELYKIQLIRYLRSTMYYRNADEHKVQELVSAIENDLLNVVRSIHNINIQVIYEILDKETIMDLINMTNSGRSLSEYNERSKGMLRNSLTYYLGYLNSNKHPLSEKEKKRGKKTPPKEDNSTSHVSEEIKTKVDKLEPESYDKLEGRKYADTVTRYERDRGNRKDCIAHYGYVCQVCGLNFERAYGELGKAFIEVHHLHPVSQGERPVNPIEDLIPLCSNCHSMIHRQEDVSDWKGLRERYLANKQSHQEDGQKS